MLYAIGPLVLFLVFTVFIMGFVTRKVNQERQLSVDSDLYRSVHMIDETVSTLSMIAEQMAYGYVSTNLGNMLEESNPYEKSRLVGSIKNEINVMSFTNLNIRLMGYYDRERGEFMLQTNGVAADGALPEEILIKKSEFIFHGPHRSIARNSNDLVISVNKTVPSVQGIEAYVELVVGFNPTNSFLQNARFVIVESNGRIGYSGIENGEELLGRESLRGRIGDYYYTGADGDGGYRVYILVPKEEYFKLGKKIFPTILLAVLLMGAVFSFMLFWLVKEIIKPLRIFEAEIYSIQQGNLEVRPFQQTGIPEYDHLLDEMAVMKQKIRELLEEAKIAQQKQARAKVEQLMYQINPHFLMNSLDTIHWLAVQDNPAEIDKVAKALNKLLYYNLKVDQGIVCLREELQAVEQYVLLQQGRFRFTYIVDVKEDKAYEARIPRFILQPIVENAIYHGLQEGGNLVVMVDAMDMLDIYVKNDGGVMDARTLRNLKEEARRSQEDSGLGIGLNYVIQILREHYGQRAQIQVLGLEGEGTVVYLSMPFIRQGGTDDSSADRGG